MRDVPAAHRRAHGLPRRLHRPGRGAPGTGLTAEDIDECDWIVVGHSHFDHLYGAERIIANTGATMIGSYETVRVMEAAGVPLERMIPVAGGERIRLADDVTVAVLPSQHSCVWSHTGMAQSGEVCLGDLGVTWQEQQERMRELQTYLATALTPEGVQHTRDAESRPQHARRRRRAAVPVRDAGGLAALPGHLRALVGIIDGARPDVAILAAAGRGNVDGEPIQGSLAEFVAARSPRCARGGCSSATTTTGCPGSRCRPTRGRCAGVAAVAPDTELLEPGYLDATDVFG